MTIDTSLEQKSELFHCTISSSACGFKKGYWEYQREIERLKGRVHELEEFVRDLQEIIAADKITDEEIARLNKWVLQFGNEKTVLNNQLVAANVDLVKMKGQLEVAVKERDSIKAKYDDVQTKYEMDDEIKKRQVELSRLEQERAHSVRELERLSGELKRVQAWIHADLVTAKTCRETWERHKHVYSSGLRVRLARVFKRDKKESEFRRELNSMLEELA